MSFYILYVSTAKEIVKEILDRLPDDATFEDISYEIYVRQSINKGLEQSENGESIPHDIAMKRFEKWLK